MVSIKNIVCIYMMACYVNTRAKITGIKGKRANNLLILYFSLFLSLFYSIFYRIDEFICSCLLFVIGIVFVIGYYAKFTFVTAYCAYIFLSAGIIACCGSVYVVKLALSGDDGGDYFR